MNRTHQNARLLSVRHLPDEDRLILGFEGFPDREFSCVADFAFSGFFPHNVLFGIDEYTLETLPPRIAADFPVLSYYLHSGDAWQIFHLSASAGLGGIIVCATL
ncbi:hypothetical protein [Conchiformibius kuhniae]|uniref:Uncharacterized protein n=1 Tax=Conchiformibius kuhniae TaxID=211502 RepID=A0A8T9MYN6_9NEIS|nr:hypothetical protein [Conchiformibius kuhniae]UOP04953.1 hypothetical protein LVJ77_00975 [Conchiformibius kuhniae]